MRRWNSLTRKHIHKPQKQQIKNGALGSVGETILVGIKNRIGKEGVVAFVTNNGFLDGNAFDGMRKHLVQDFSKIYH